MAVMIRVQVISAESSQHSMYGTILGFDDQDRMIRARILGSVARDLAERLLKEQAVYFDVYQASVTATWLPVPKRLEDYRFELETGIDGDFWSADEKDRFEAEMAQEQYLYERGLVQPDCDVDNDDDDDDGDDDDGGDDNALQSAPTQRKRRMTRIEVLNEMWLIERGMEGEDYGNAPVEADIA